MPKQSAPYGTWSSAITPKSLGESLVFEDVQWDSASDTLVWHERRGGKGILVAQADEQAPRDLTTDFAVRALVGYGGGNFTVGNGQVIFAAEGRLYRQALSGGGARAITPAFGSAAAPRLAASGDWLVYVHSDERRDVLALVDAEGKLWPRKLAEGTDFVMQPAWHPAGDYLAYIAWDHPNMPWDGTELRLITLEYDRAGVPFAARTDTIAGDATTAIFQPEFSPDGRYLAYISDQTGLGQLMIYELATRQTKPVTTSESEKADPAWIQGMRTYGWTHDSRYLIFIQNHNGQRRLAYLDVQQPTETRLEALNAYSNVDQVAVSPRSSRIAVIASSSTCPARVISLPFEGASDVPPTLQLPASDPLTMQVIPSGGAAPFIHKRSSNENIAAADLSVAQPITWTGHDGEPVHGLYYPPVSQRFTSSGQPPVILYIHGGPTSQVIDEYFPAAQFFATRGIALLAVNYRGSTGYGKAYMNKLRGNWGIYDVEDAATGATHLANSGLADPKKLVILGGSAGGFTVLQSLVEKPGLYKAGVCLYGVSNQFGLVMDTHKFEERYSESLLGALPEAAEVYRARSPLFHANRIVDPIIVYQGEDDPVVPRNQSDAIVASLRARNVPHEYHVYAGEGHGWRKSDTIAHYYESLMKFLLQYVVYG